MERTDVRLAYLTADDYDQFIRDNQEAFRFGYMEHFGMRNQDMDDGDEIISSATILQSIGSGIAYRIWANDEKVGGMVLKTVGNRGFLELLFVNPSSHTQGIGYAAWCAAEKLYPEVTVWETCTPYFEQRNIHFYVNRCGFHVVEYFNAFHPDPNDPDIETSGEQYYHDGFDGMFRFEKVIRNDNG